MTIIAKLKRGIALIATCCSLGLFAPDPFSALAMGMYCGWNWNDIYDKAIAQLKKLNNLFKHGPKPAESRRCEDCKWSSDYLCLQNPYWVFASKTRRSQHGPCGPSGKYWEGKE